MSRDHSTPLPSAPTLHFLSRFDDCSNIIQRTAYGEMVNHIIEDERKHRGGGESPSAEDEDLKDPATAALDKSRTDTDVKSFRGRILHLLDRVYSLITIADNGDYSTFRSYKLDDYPNGYPLLAAFTASDPNFAIYRGFGYLRNRILQRRQERLAFLEKELNDMDNEDAIAGPVGEYRLKSYAYDKKRDSKRHDLLDMIEKEIKEYGDRLLWEQQLRALDKPNARNMRSFYNFCNNYKPLGETEGDFIYNPYPEDFVTLASEKENSYLNGKVEDLLNKHSGKWFQALFADPEQREKTTQAEMHYYSKERIERLVRGASFIASGLLLMVPIGLLLLLPATNAIKFGIVAAFVLVFPLLLSMFTVAKKHEIQAVTAAYCAVLVVFLGNINNLANSVPANRTPH